MLSTYLKRVAAMLLLAMPLTVLGVAAIGLLNNDQRSAGLGTTLGEAFGLVYVWGIVTAIAASLVHTAVIRSLSSSSLSTSLAIGGVLGALAGAATPTFFTGFLQPSVIIAGTLTGLVYAAIVSRLLPLRY